MSSHQSARMQTDEWLTPPQLIQALGSFDLDPCAPVKRPWGTAKRHYTIRDNGLLCSWEGRVWLNPPYGNSTEEWLQKLHQHGDGIALLFARTETAVFFRQVWAKADALFFIKGRLYFHHIDGTRADANAGAPSVLIAYGPENVEALRTCSIMGYFIKLERGLQCQT